MIPRWRVALVVCGACALISTVTSRSTLAEKAKTGDVPAEIPVVQAPTNLGSGSCATSQCHTAVREWAIKLDGDGKKQHYNAANQLEARTYPVVRKFMAAVGTNTDPYADRTCLGCHTTAIGRDDFEGVTCEKCHGPGSKYKETHDDKKGAGAAPYTSLGMKDYKKSPKEWVRLCVDCHVLDPQKYRALVGAGHPDGSEFDVASAFLKVQGPPNTHWATRKYTRADVAPFVPAKPRPAPAPATPTPAPPPPGPAPVVKSTPAPTPASGPPVIRPTATPAPVPTPVVVVPPIPPVVRPIVTARPAPPVVASTPAPAPAPNPPVAPPPSVPPDGIPNAAPSAEPRTLSGIVASVQGRLINVLASLLRQNATVPQRVVPPAKAIIYSGPDADLLKLQDDVISLALEVLGKAPVKSGGSQ